MAYRTNALRQPSCVGCPYNYYFGRRLSWHTAAGYIGPTSWEQHRVVEKTATHDPEAIGQSRGGKSSPPAGYRALVCQCHHPRVGAHCRCIGRFTVCAVYTQDRKSVV